MDLDAKKVKQTMKRVKKTLSWSAMSKSSRSAMNRSKSIDHQLEEEREKKEKEVLLLVLGGACSGKSTFVKQLRLHYGDGFPETERVKYVNQVYDNLATAGNKVIENMKTMEMKFDSDALQDEGEGFQKRNPILNLKELLKHVPDSDYPATPTNTCSSPTGGGGGVGGGGEGGANSLIAMACSELTKRFTYLNLKCNGMSTADQKLLMDFWQDAGFQRCFETRSKFEKDFVLTPQEVYFLGNINRILTENYVPTLQDILYIRRPTLGVIEHLFHTESLSYRVIDVAGQKSQRKKWIHLFENITAVLFFVSLNEFDEMLEEDDTLNSLQDSLSTFREVSHNRYLDRTDFLLFLNKYDLFLEKLKITQLNATLADYKGDNTPDDCVKHIRDLFHEHRPCHKQVYTHVSCATDVTMMRDILAKILDIVTEINLRKAGGVF